MRGRPAGTGSIAGSLLVAAGWALTLYATTRGRAGVAGLITYLALVVVALGSTLMTPFIVFGSFSPLTIMQIGGAGPAAIGIAGVLITLKLLTNRTT